MSPPHVALVCSGPPQKRGHLWLSKVASVLGPLDSKRCELDELICATAREKDEIHLSARELQSQVDAAHHNLVFAMDSQQRLADLHRLQYELKLHG